MQSETESKGSQSSFILQRMVRGGVKVSLRQIGPGAEIAVTHTFGRSWTVAPVAAAAFHNLSFGQQGESASV